MAIHGVKNDSPEGRRLSWRPLVRAFHRDLGYLLIGLTIVYAVSGLAVNHISDWDPSFKNVRRVRDLPLPVPRDDQALAALVRGRFELADTPEIVFSTPERVDLQQGARLFHVDPVSGRAVEDGRQPRAFLRVANWLHLNRGKKAWTFVADLYAAGLLILAISGLFMLPGRKGLLGRGGLLALLGAAVPILYVLLSGGPQKSGSTVGPVGSARFAQCGVELRRGEVEFLRGPAVAGGGRRATLLRPSRTRAERTGAHFDSSAGVRRFLSAAAVAGRLLPGGHERRAGDPDRTRWTPVRQTAG